MNQQPEACPSCGTPRASTKDIYCRQCLAKWATFERGPSTWKRNALIGGGGIGGLFLLIVIIGIASGGHGKKSAASPPADPASASTPQPIMGFGALDADWEKVHKRGKGPIAPGSEIDLMPGVAYDKQADGTFRYASVEHTAGRISGYTMQLPSPGVTRDEAIRTVEAELPPDANLGEDRRLAGCEMLVYQSDALGAALADPRIGGEEGYVLVTFSSLLINEVGDPLRYDDQRIDTIDFGSWPTASSGDIQC